MDEVRPYSPYQQEILKIYEEYVLHDVKEIPDDITAIIKNLTRKKPTNSLRLVRYCITRNGWIRSTSVPTRGKLFRWAAS